MMLRGPHPHLLRALCLRGADGSPPAPPPPCHRSRYKAAKLWGSTWTLPSPPTACVLMARHATLVAVALALLLLLAPRGLAWYKPAAGPSHYSVGRAAGLLSGFRGSPFARRSELAVGTGLQRRAGASSELRPSLRSLAVCVKDVTPNLQSCQRLPDGGGSGGTFQCKADVFLSLRASDCHRT
ncbi:neuropeptide B [Ictidomys tridecemlineatus]|nr:neuropeptide B [Ictidomys tridecemlineatus]KAG3268273.1 neuropeptide B [Ictidomys tridecemlineatus]